MIPYIEIELSNPTTFFEEDYFTEEDDERVKAFIEEGYEQDALDFFINEYMTPPAVKYQDLMVSYLNAMDAGVMYEQDRERMIRNVVLMTLGVINVFNSNFKNYLNGRFSKEFFENAGITSASTRKAILLEVENNFEQLVTGNLTRTQLFITNSLRAIQREIVSENMILKNFGLSEEAAHAEIIRFRNSLRSRYPKIYDVINKNMVLVTSNFVDGVERIRKYKLEYYVDLVTRTAILDVDRNTNMIAALAEEERVVEFYLSDPRQVKDERVICQEILSKQVLGKSILALDTEAGAILGIMTVDEARNTPDYSFGPYCRHSVRRCPAEYLSQINKLLVG